MLLLFFFFNWTATPDIYTYGHPLSLHDALPISTAARMMRAWPDRFSDSTGLRLCGIAEEPFCPGAKNSSASRTSVRCRWRISVASRSTPEAMTARRSEEHTSELQSLMRISYAVFCLKKKTQDITTYIHNQ